MTLLTRGRKTQRKPAQTELKLDIRARIPYAGRDRSALLIMQVQGLKQAYDYKKVLKALKKDAAACPSLQISAATALWLMTLSWARYLFAAGSEHQRAENAALPPNHLVLQVIQLQGDQRKNVQDFLLNVGEAGEKEPDQDSRLLMHGESKWRPLELCWSHDLPELPAKGKGYPGLGYKWL
ncbi:hypothetical protein QJQ45_017853 [Haematococcus lacustris]|nr:hypothetical protein QJQ45_017853 [Haematococcus lacustris]